MNHLHSIVLTNLLLTAFLFASQQLAFAQTQAASLAAPQQARAAAKTYNPNLVEQGANLFRRDCGFCHGRDAGGGETGPDLTRSILVSQDVNGDKIGPVVTNGRPEAGMPPFDVSEKQVAELVAFIHTQQKNANTRKGGRKGVDAVDLQTGNVAAGKKYFEGAADAPPATPPPAISRASPRG
jgi:cytochrome c oxidase cbb3-type subunit III